MRYLIKYSILIASNIFYALIVYGLVVPGLVSYHGNLEFILGVFFHVVSPLLQIVINVAIILGDVKKLWRKYEENK